MTGERLIKLASYLRRSDMEKMCHALGWPHPDRYGTPGHRRVRWLNPWRNYYGAPEDPEWGALVALGLAKVIPNPPCTEGYAYWAVTDLGRTVLRLRLTAERWAREAS